MAWYGTLTIKGFRVYRLKLITLGNLGNHRTCTAMLKHLGLYFRVQNVAIGKWIFPRRNRTSCWLLFIVIRNVAKTPFHQAYLLQVRQYAFSRYYEQMYTVDKVPIAIPDYHQHYVTIQVCDPNGRSLIVLVGGVHSPLYTTHHYTSKYLNYTRTVCLLCTRLVWCTYLFIRIATTDGMGSFHLKTQH